MLDLSFHPVKLLGVRRQGTGSQEQRTMQRIIDLRDTSHALNSFPPYPKSSAGGPASQAIVEDLILLESYCNP